MTSLVINNLKSRIYQQAIPVSPGIIINTTLPVTSFVNGGPESTRLYGCQTCIVNSKVVPDRPSSLGNSRTPIVSVKSTPDSITTKKRDDNMLSLPRLITISSEQRFAFVLPPNVPPPDIIAICNPYRNTNEPTARIPPCIGPKRINT